MNLLAVEQFIGTEWVYLTHDCYAVVRKASLAVFGRALPHHYDIPAASDPGRNAALFAGAAVSSEWKPIGVPSDGCVVLFYDRAGRPVHVGLHVTCGNVLHCPGSVRRPGTTRYERLADMHRIYRDMRFYEHRSDYDTPRSG